MSDQLSFEDHEDDLRLRQCWNHVIDQAAMQLPPKMAERFLYSSKAKSVHFGKAKVEVPSSFNAEWLRTRCKADLERILSDEMGEQMQIDFIVSAVERKSSAAAAHAAVQMQPMVTELGGSFKPNSKFTFDNFIAGPSNRLAVAGARAVADNPGGKFNPLFIYGPSGLGKTHLLHAIAGEVLRKNPRYPLAYITAQQFAEEFVQSLHNGKIEQFRRAQRSVSLWLVDDIQFIAGKDRTQEEIFYTFNALQKGGRQIVLCSDRSPRELCLMGERLRSRFESGLLADVQPPDTETRCAIIRSKAAQEDIVLPMDAAMLLAEQVPGNIRVLEGAMIRLAAIASIQEQLITLDLARQIVEDMQQTAPLVRLSANQIIDVVSKNFKIPTEDIKGSSRKAPIALARHVAVYLTREVTNDSWKHIGAQFGNKDHTSMIHAHQKISEMIARDRDFSNTVKALLRNLHPGN